MSAEEIDAAFEMEWNGFAESLDIDEAFAERIDDGSPAAEADAAAADEAGPKAANDDEENDIFKSIEERLGQLDEIDEPAPGSTENAPQTAPPREDAGAEKNSFGRRHKKKKKEKIIKDTLR